MCMVYVCERVVLFNRFLKFKKKWFGLFFLCGVVNVVLFNNIWGGCGREVWVFGGLLMLWKECNMRYVCF